MAGRLDKIKSTSNKPSISLRQPDTRPISKATVNTSTKLSANVKPTDMEGVAKSATKGAAAVSHPARKPLVSKGRAPPPNMSQVWSMAENYSNDPSSAFIATTDSDMEDESRDGGYKPLSRKLFDKSSVNSKTDNSLPVKPKSVKSDSSNLKRKAVFGDNIERTAKETKVDNVSALKKPLPQKSSTLTAREQLMKEIEEKQRMLAKLDNGGAAPKATDVSNSSERSSATTSVRSSSSTKLATAKTLPTAGNNSTAAFAKKNSAQSNKNETPPLQRKQPGDATSSIRQKIQMPKNNAAMIAEKEKEIRRQLAARAELDRRQRLREQASSISHDDDDDEYDSDLDDFIDDSEAILEESSKVELDELLKKQFRYDKKKYRNMNDDDDPAMEEKSYRRIMAEEARSARLGLLEDLKEAKKGSTKI